MPDGPKGDDESDDTASISSNASSIKDLTDLEITTRTRKQTGVRQTKCEIVEEQDGPKATNNTRSKRRLVLVEKMKIKDEPNSQDEESKVLGTRKSERRSKEKLVASKSSSRGKIKDETIVAQESDESRTDSDPAPASGNRGGRKETYTDTQNDTDKLMGETTSRQRSKRKTAGGKTSAVGDSFGEKHKKTAATILRKVEVESATEPNSAREGTFVVPKPVTRTARQKRLQESTAQEESSAQEDLPMDKTPETRKRGRKGTAVTVVTPTATTKPEQAETTVSRGRKGRKSTPPTITVNEDKTPKPAKSPTTEGPVAQKETDQESNKRGIGRTKREAAGWSVSPAKKARQSDHSAREGGDQSSPSASFARQARHQGTQPALSPSLRRRSSDVKPRVLFTGVQNDSWEKTVTGLGGELMDSVHDCSHLVTDKVRRTVKFLCCLAQGVLIVTPEWLEKSKSSRAFVDPIPFLLKDKAAERQHRFSLSASLQKAGQHRLLRGYKVHVTPGVKPEPPQMKDIIKCAGGEYLTKFPSKVGPQTVVVSCDADRSLWGPASKGGIPVVSSEFILTGILTQEVMLAQYRLQ